MKWLEKLNNALSYIEEHLEDEISFEKAAHAACCSVYYFQRIFSYVAGVSLSEYIRRRRMTQAGFELQRTEQKVIDVALKYGYSSPTSFNRAFQSIHGIAPFEAKNIGSKLNAYPAIKFSVKVIGGNAIAYHIEKKEAIRIVGIRTQLSEDMEENLKSIPLFWDKALSTEEFQTICELSNQETKGVLGISAYKNPKDIFYYIASATNKEIPAGMFEYEIPASTWVVFENDGYLKENVQNVLDAFIQSGCRFRVMNMRDCLILKSIQFIMKS
nr:AraC family transcriptional regulator [Treponema pedis]